MLLRIFIVFGLQTVQYLAKKNSPGASDFDKGVGAEGDW
jgi:hypothetical protein